VATGCGGLRLHPAVGEGCRRWRGTGSSNPSPSSGESAANLRRGSFGAVVTDPCLLCVLFRAGLRLRRQART
jgi:hypothetical protein